MTTANKISVRATSAEKISVRENTEEGKRYIEWYPIVFNQRSRLIREYGEEFYEVIEPSAPESILRDESINTKATVDHDRSKMLGRTKSGTLQLRQDDHGVKAIVEVPNTTVGNDTYEQVKRGDYFEGSFIYTIAENGVRYDRAEKTPVRYVSNLRNLIDVSIVQDGAFATNGVAIRGLLEFEENQNQPTSENSNASLDILKKRTAIHKLNS
ncbi:HK97 family phage prohead protease [Sunxiuqinia indica]|uniref:HK97 family phage prohead protease n=1 Tax=Sunxiuqinia indica TaxID=2692584 RepID=UPI00135A17D8|nr:HK97 family phage prohead protease [Sunxiuqinia indica]